MNDEQRQQAVRKVIRYVAGQRETTELAASVEKYVADLSDDQLAGLVRVAGTAARKSDVITVVRGWIKDDRDGVLAFLIDNPTMEFTAVDYDHARTMFAIMRSFGRPTSNNTVHWHAHLKALTSYDAFDMSDHWVYSNNIALMEIVDAHPEDVDAIVRLRNEFQHRVVTEEILAEYKATHRALNVGLL